MKDPTCPHCGCKLPQLRSKFVADKAIRQVLKLASKPTAIRQLAERYSRLTEASYLSSRRAVERLVTYGHLKRVKQGYYVRAYDNSI